VAYLGVLVAGLLAYAVAPGEGPRAALYLTLAATAPLVLFAGIRLHRPPYPLPWYLAGAGLGSYLVADLIFYYQDLNHEGVVPFPGLADGFYLASYPFVISALLLLIRRRDPGRDVASLIDACIIAASVALIEWVYLVEPRLEANETTGAGSLVIVATLLGDIVILAVAVRLVGATGHHRPAFYLFSLGVGALLITNTFYAFKATVDYRTGTVLDAGWLCYYFLLAAAALHPSMRTLAEPTRSRNDGRTSQLRLVLLSAAVLVAPVILFVQNAREDAHSLHDDLPVIALGSVILFSLVMARIAVLMQAQNATAARERTLRSAAAVLVGATHRGGIYDAAMEAASNVVGPQLLATRLLIAADDVVDVAAAAGANADTSLGGRIDGKWLGSLDGAIQTDETVRTVCLDSDVRAWLGLRGVEGELLVSRILVQGVTRGALLAVTDGPPRPGVVAGLDTLTAQLALALESVALTEDLHTRQSEARFRALVQNSSDAIFLVDSDTVVRYQSPSVERVLGFPADGLLGRSLLELVSAAEDEQARAFFAGIARQPGISVPIELTLQRKDGAWIDAEVVCNNLEQEEQVKATVVTVRDVSERKQFERQLSHQAFHDDLTGLANRALFDDRLSHALARKSRDDSPLAVVLIDLDDFKLINDGLGHAAGDTVLVVVAERLRRLFRPGDTTARMGGDEFAIALESLTQEEGAFRAVERALAVLREPLVVEGKEVFIEASAGIAFADDGAVTTEELLRNADVAMYVAKTEGKGRYAIYESRMHAAALERLDLRADLQRALDNGEFLLHYQPIVALDNGRTVGLEALVRWQHPERGMVAPGDFIALAEETGLVVPLGRWVLDHACQQASKWKGNGNLSMSINLSQKQLQLPELPDEVSDSLSRSGVDPSRITLEITESAVMSDVEATVRTLHKLRELGVRLAVDDFGTGYSSLSWLRQLPIDVLKIDKEFVDGIASRAEDSMLVGAVIDLAHNLGLRTVAEGIEGADQLAGLRQLHCDFGQGYFFARPLPAGQVGDRLSAEGEDA
jgi:diguanylate cyclase (GGDEF)-like protein/PAS domain S-box-containing protein